MHSLQIIWKKFLILNIYINIKNILYLRLNQSSSGCGENIFPLSYRGLPHSRLIIPVLIPHGLTKECLFPIKKGIFLGMKDCFWRKKAPFSKMVLFEKKLDALWVDPDLAKIWTWDFGMGWEQLTSEVEVITSCNFAFTSLYALLRKKCFHSLKNEHFFTLGDFSLKETRWCFSSIFYGKKCFEVLAEFESGLFALQFYLWAFSDFVQMVVYTQINHPMFTSSASSASSFSGHRKKRLFRFCRPHGIFFWDLFFWFEWLPFSISGNYKLIYLYILSMKFLLISWRWH